MATATKIASKTPASAPPPAAAAPPAPKPKQEKKAAAPPPTPAPTPAPAPAAADPASPAPEEEEVPAALKLVSEAQEIVAAAASSIKDLTALLKTLQKENQRLVKASKKKNRKRQNGGENAKPGGFAKPTKVSDEMCDFLKIERGIELPRHQVTKRLSEYIRANNLQLDSNRRIILPDAKLRKLLKLDDSVKEMAYAQMQTHIKPHFPPTQAQQAAAAAAAAAK